MTLMTAMPAAVSPPTVTADELAAMEDAINYELVDGILRERNISEESSRVGARIVGLFFFEAGRVNNVLIYGTDLGYQCFLPGASKEIRKPDVSVIRKSRRELLPKQIGYMPIPADLAVEVLSPNDLVREVNDKVEEYLAAGFPIVWIVDPVLKTVTIHRQGGTVTKLYEHEEITGETALPGFRCRVGEMIG